MEDKKSLLTKRKRNTKSKKDQNSDDDLSPNNPSKQPKNRYKPIKAIKTSNLDDPYIQIHNQPSTNNANQQDPFGELTKPKKKHRKTKNLTKPKATTVEPYVYGSFCYKSRMFRYIGEINEFKEPQGEGEIQYFEKDNYEMHPVHYKGYINRGPHGENVTLYYANKKVWYKGSMKYGYCEGYGTDYYLRGNMRYKGFYKNGGPNGSNLTVYPCSHFSSGYYGNMIEGRRQGFGKEYDNNGKQIQIGNYENDQFQVLKGTHYHNNGKMSYRSGANKFCVLFQKNGQIRYMGQNFDRDTEKRKKSLFSVPTSNFLLQTFINEANFQILDEQDRWRRLENVDKRLKTLAFNLHGKRIANGCRCDPRAARIDQIDAQDDAEPEIYGQGFDWGWGQFCFAYCRFSLLMELDRLKFDHVFSYKPLAKPSYYEKNISEIYYI